MIHQKKEHPKRGAPFSISSISVTNDDECCQFPDVRTCYFLFKSFFDTEEPSASWGVRPTEIPTTFIRHCHHNQTGNLLVLFLYSFLNLYHRRQLQFGLNQLFGTFECQVDVRADILLAEHRIEARLMEYGLYGGIDT